MPKKENDDRAVLGVSGLKDPGTGDMPCPWWTDERTPGDKRKGIDGVDYLMEYEKLEMWVCLSARAAVAASWWKTAGVDAQHGLWQQVFEEAMKRLWEEGAISE